MPDFNQHDVIIKINQYLKSRNRSVSLESGYCHGIALLWLYKISAGQEQWFYNIVMKIADCKNDDDFNEIEWDLELFISYIEWLQNSCLYLRGVNQLDIDKLAELTKDYSLSFLFHHSQLDSILKFMLKNDKLICISGPDHTIGIYVKGGNTFVLDPKYNKLQPKIINDIETLKFEIVRSLFRRDYLPECRLPLEFVVLENPDNPNSSNNITSGCEDIPGFYAQLIKECKNVDTPGMDGITNMHLACESGNENEVRQLLEAGAKPNQICKSQWTPMHVSSLRGDTSIVKLLMKFGASPFNANQSGVKPIDLARAAGHEDILRLFSEPDTSPTGCRL